MTLMDDPPPTDPTASTTLRWLQSETKKTVGRWPSEEIMMPDDKQNLGPEHDRISLAEEDEVRYWTDTLGVSEEDLRHSVGEVGHSLEAVRANLGSKLRPEAQ
jgi:hypothetical protein